jgi:hypothetical protein
VRHRVAAGGVAVTLLIGIVWFLVGDVPFVTAPWHWGEPRAQPVAPGRDTPQLPFLDDPRGLVDPSTGAGHDALVRAVHQYFLSDHEPSVSPWETQQVFSRVAATEQWAEGRMVSFVNFDPWSVPNQPTWAEDPYDNISWQSSYHSLAWLRAPARLSSETGDERYLEDVRTYVLDWIRDNPQDDAPSVRSWYDHSVAWRTDTLVHVLSPELIGRMTPFELEQVLRSLHEHGIRLLAYLSEERFVGHNHNLFHALSLHSLAIAFPELAGADRWGSVARDRVTSLFAEMVDVADGVSREQAAGYHFLALRLFDSADAYLSQHGDGLSQSELTVLSRMVEFGSLLIRPDGTVPATGDTSYGSSPSRDELRAWLDDGLGTPIAEFLVTDGASGVAPAAINTYPSVGFAILRAVEGDSATPAIHATVDLEPARRSHGHDDAMSVTLWMEGQPILVDSGGPFVYGGPRRQNFVLAPAHNVVTVGGNGVTERAEITHEWEHEDSVGLQLEGTTKDGVTHRRTATALGTDAFVIVDWLDAVGDTADITLTHHLPPDSHVELHDDETMAAVAVDGLPFTITIVTSEDSPLRVHAGSEEPPFGWVTPAYLQRVPAPVLTSSATARSAWFVTVVTAESDAFELSVSQEGGDLSVRLGDDETGWDLNVPADGIPTVAWSTR